MGVKFDSLGSWVFVLGLIRGLFWPYDWAHLHVIKAFLQFIHKSNLLSAPDNKQDEANEEGNGYLGKMRYNTT